MDRISKTEKKKSLAIGQAGTSSLVPVCHHPRLSPSPLTTSATPDNCADPRGTKKKNGKRETQTLRSLTHSLTHSQREREKKKPSYFCRYRFYYVITRQQLIRAHAHIHEYNNACTPRYRTVTFLSPSAKISNGIHVSTARLPEPRGMRCDTRECRWPKVHWGGSLFLFPGLVSIFVPTDWYQFFGASQGGDP